MNSKNASEAAMHFMEESKRNRNDYASLRLGKIRGCSEFGVYAVLKSAGGPAHSKTWRKPIRPVTRVSPPRRESAPALFRRLS
jgi:hypothetical protein